MTLANLPVDAYIVYDLATDTPVAVRIDATWQGIIRWGIDYKGEPSRNIVDDNGSFRFLDAEGALDIAIRAEGTDLTPGGRKIQLNELLGGNIGILILPSGSTNVNEYLWRGVGVVEPRSQRGEAEIQLSSVVQNQLTKRTAINYEARSAELYESERYKQALEVALAIDTPVDIQTGNLDPPLKIVVDNVVARDLLKQAGIWARGLSLVGLGGKITVISEGEMDTARYAYEPITIRPNSSVDLRGDVQVDPRTSIGDITEVSIDTRFNYPGNADVFMHANDQVISFMHSDRVTNINNHYIYSPRLDDSPRLVLQRRYNVQDSHFAVVEPFRRVNNAAQTSYFLVLKGNDARLLTYDPTRNDYRVGAPVRLQFGGINIAYFGNRLYTLHNDNVRTFPVATPAGITSARGNIAFSFASENRISDNSFISVGSKGIDILDGDTRILYRYSNSGTLLANLPVSRLLPIGQQIRGIATIGDRICVLMTRIGRSSALLGDSNLGTVYCLNLEGFKQPSTPVIALPDVPPKWRIVDPEIMQPLLERPALNMAITGVSVTGIGDGSADDAAPVRINARTSYLDERTEDLDGWFVNSTLTSEIAGWLSSEAVIPPNILQMSLLVTDWDSQYVSATNRRLDVGTRVRIVDGDFLVHGLIVGRGLEWDYLFLYIHLAIYVVNRTAYTPDIGENTLTWLDEPIEWLGEELTYA